MSVTGEVDGEPQRVGSPVADNSAGMFACISILAALYVRKSTGQGQHIDISLFEAAVSLLGNVSANYLISGEEAQRLGNDHPNIVPYQAFRTSNGYIVVSCGNDRLYQALCKLLDREELATDPRFTTNPLRVRNRNELIPTLQESFQKRETDEWLAERCRRAALSGSASIQRQELSSFRGRPCIFRRRQRGCIRLLRCWGRIMKGS